MGGCRFGDNRRQQGGVDSLTVPAAVIVGDADRLTPAAHSVDLAARLGRRGGVLFEFTLLDKVGHMSNLEAVGDFNSAVARLDRSA